MRLRGRMVYYSCRVGFILYGQRAAVCVRGKWNHPKPVCVAPGCKLPKVNGNVTYSVSFKGAVLTYSCPLGFVTRDKTVSYCQRNRWTGKEPTCKATKGELSCDFEDEHLCEWYQDKSDMFDWTRKAGLTQTPKTGPMFDHTYGTKKLGYYMYTEASSPRVTGDRARLLSPLYAQSLSAGCFYFWYFMYGKGVGRLSVFIKPANMALAKLSPAWRLIGDQGQIWKRVQVKIPRLEAPFQIIFESFRKNSYLGDIAIDDVALRNCSEKETTVTESPVTNQRNTSSIVTNNTMSTTQAVTTHPKITKTTLKTDDLRNGVNSGQTTMAISNVSLTPRPSLALTSQPKVATSSPITAVANTTVTTSEMTAVVTDTSHISYTPSMTPTITRRTDYGGTSTSTSTLSLPMSTTIQTTKIRVPTMIQTTKTRVPTTIQTTKTRVPTTIQTTKTRVSTTIQTTKTQVSTTIQTTKTRVPTTIKTTKTRVPTTIKTTKTRVSTTIQTPTTRVTAKLQTMKTRFPKTIQTTKTRVPTTIKTTKQSHNPKTSFFFTSKTDKAESIYKPTPKYNNVLTTLGLSTNTNEPSINGHTTANSIYISTKWRSEDTNPTHNDADTKRHWTTNTKTSPSKATPTEALGNSNLKKNAISGQQSTTEAPPVKMNAKYITMVVLSVIAVVLLLIVIISAYMTRKSRMKKEQKMQREEEKPIASLIDLADFGGL